MSKLFTAVSIMQLVEKNLLSLDDDARDYVPELKGIQILRGIKTAGGKFIRIRLINDDFWIILSLIPRRKWFSLYIPTPYRSCSR